MTYPAIQVLDLTVRFGDFVAIDRLTFGADYERVRGVIGPNGAGKTTLLDVITGKSKPESGDVLLDGQFNLADMSEAERALAGIGRKFQKPSVFEALTVAENLDLALRLYPKSLRRDIVAPMRRKREPIDRVLEQIGLAGSRNAVAGALSHGEKQWLEIGMVLIMNPKVLLLDEPVAGLSDAETERTAELVKALRSPERSIVIVEHDMNFVERVADQVTVLHEGRTLFDGSMAEARKDPRVIDVYIGR